MVPIRRADDQPDAFDIAAVGPRTVNHAELAVCGSPESTQTPAPAILRGASYDSRVYFGLRNTIAGIIPVRPQYAGAAHCRA